MTPAVRFPLLQRCLFVAGYIFGKFTVLWEVRRPRLRFFLYEMKYSLANGLRKVLPFVQPRLYQGPTLIETVHGRYRVRAGTHDAAITSPAFERRDRQRLEQVLESAFVRSPSVYFLDIGANIGAFSIAAALRFPELDVYAFEPVPQNLEVLRENVGLNSLSNVRVFPIALSDRNGSAEIQFVTEHPGDSHLGRGGMRIETRRLDEILPTLPATAAVVIKIDVEGHEPQVLRGIGESLRGHSVFLMIEDMFEAEALYTLLRELGFEFKVKLSPYNSWWERH